MNLISLNQINIEVHHPHHPPKKASEYFTEFIMLFAAVTLGFFAENLREHQIEKQRYLNRFDLPEHARPLKHNNPEDINELVNLGIAPVNSTRYINGHLGQLKAQCIALNKLLMDTYGSDF